MDEYATTDDEYLTDEDEELAARVVVGTVMVNDDGILIKHAQPDDSVEDAFFCCCMDLLLAHLEVDGALTSTSTSQLRELLLSSDGCARMASIVGPAIKTLHRYSLVYELAVSHLVFTTGELVPNMQFRVRRRANARWPRCPSPVPFG